MLKIQFKNYNETSQYNNGFKKESESLSLAERIKKVLFRLQIRLIWLELFHSI